jgi:hypothetical protein
MKNFSTVNTNLICSQIRNCIGQEKPNEEKKNYNETNYN